jgi:hypothetical protein
MTDDRSRGVHLTDKELVFVVIAATIVAGVVFLCGVLVGRGVPSGPTGAAEGTMMTPTQVVSDGSADSAGTDPPPADAAGTGRVGAELSYAGRLGKTPPANTLKLPAESTPPPVPVETTPPPDVANDVSGTPDTPAEVAVPYTVQVAFEKKRSEADAVVKYMKAKGFDARVYVPDDGDKVGGFRVRVGALTTRKEAEALAQRIARETRYKQPWVTR